MQIRLEKERLKEEASAMILQGAWRTKKARRKAAAMKAEKQRLLEEGSAMMLQGAWRCKKAKRRAERAGAVGAAGFEVEPAR